MNIVIVESPAKAKTVNKYLGAGYRVLASYGHVRDLPSKNGSVEPDKDFEMHWDVEPKAAKRLDEIAKALKGAHKLILATDPDREGEAISWHVLQVLNRKKLLTGVPVERVVFNAVTKESVLEAMRHPREIDGPLVNAYLARRALDYLVGFTLSPVLWRKLPGARSAGRVQSVALRLVCDRELDIEKFKAQEYWSILAELATAKNEIFTGRLVTADGKKLDKFDIADAEAAAHLKAALEGGTFTVASIETKPQRRNPAAPFTTSTLQQEASRKLGFSPRQTMQLAQRLYEGVDMGAESEGLITYMRTDGVQIVPEAIAKIRQVLAKLYGDRYVPDSPREYQAKAKNAQEAHEAIRPTDFTKDPDSVSRYLEDDAAKLYRLIWQRTLASQASSADIERTSIDIDVKGNDGKTYGLRATGQVVRFDGFLKLYEEGVDDIEGEDGRLPILSQGAKLDGRSIEAKQHFTEPPPRYSEATLIKKMEELGIGRPSTYASTLNVLRDRL
jgi:DNA topoisomerase-1